MASGIHQAEQNERRHADLLLYLPASDPETETAAITGALSDRKGCWGVHSCERGGVRLLQVRHDPAVLPCGDIRRLLERAGCRAKIVGL